MTAELKVRTEVLKLTMRCLTQSVPGYGLLVMLVQNTEESEDGKLDIASNIPRNKLAVIFRQLADKWDAEAHQDERARQRGLS